MTTSFGISTEPTRAAPRHGISHGDNKTMGSGNVILKATGSLERSTSRNPQKEPYLDIRAASNYEQVLDLK